MHVDTHLDDDEHHKYSIGVMVAKFCNLERIL